MPSNIEEQLKELIHKHTVSMGSTHASVEEAYDEKGMVLLTVENPRLFVSELLSLITSERKEAVEDFHNWDMNRPMSMSKVPLLERYFLSLKTKEKL
jgi:hypothetical protein